MKFRSASRHGLWLSAGSSWSPGELEPDFFVDAQAEAERRALTTAQTAVLAQWDDDSANGYNVAITGGPVLMHDGTRWLTRWDGVDDQGELPIGARGLFRNLTGATILSVYAASTIKVNQMLMYALAGGTAARVYHNVLDGNRIRLAGKRLDANALQLVDSPGGSISLGVFSVIAGAFNWGAALLTAYKNGIQVAQRNPFQTAGATSNTDSGVNITLGYQQAGAGHIQGDLIAHAVYKRILTVDELQQFTNYYNVRSSLGL